MGRASSSWPIGPTSTSAWTTSSTRRRSWRSRRSPSSASAERAMPAKGSGLAQWVSGVKRGSPVRIAPPLVHAADTAATTHDAPRFILRPTRAEHLLRLHRDLDKVDDRLMKTHAHAHVQASPERRPRQGGVVEPIQRAITIRARLPEQLQHAREPPDACVGEFGLRRREPVARQARIRDGQRVFIAAARRPLDLSCITQLHRDRVSEKVPQRPLAIVCRIQELVVATDQETDDVAVGHLRQVEDPCDLGSIRPLRRCRERVLMTQDVVQNELDRRGPSVHECGLAREACVGEARDRCQGFERRRHRREAKSSLELDQASTPIAAEIFIAPTPARSSPSCTRIALGRAKWVEANVSSWTARRWPIATSAARVAAGTRTSTSVSVDSQCTRGVFTAAWGPIPQSATFVAMWTIALMILRPPGAPAQRNGSSPRSMRSGAIAGRIRRPPAIEFTCPGRGSNQVITFASTIPVPRATTPEPNPPPSVVVRLTIRRSRSMTFTCVVQSLDGGTAVAPAPGDARSGSIEARARAACSFEPSHSYTAVPTPSGSPRYANRSANARRSASAMRCSAGAPSGAWPPRA